MVHACLKPDSRQCVLTTTLPSGYSGGYLSLICHGLDKVQQLSLLLLDPTIIIVLHLGVHLVQYQK